MHANRRLESAEESMMKSAGRFLRVVWVGAVLFALASCGSDSSSSRGGGSPPESQITENTKVIDDTEAIAALDASSVSDASGVLVFGGGAPELAAGDVVVMGVTEKTPQGLLRKVVAVRQEGEETIVETEPAKLTDAVISGSISVSGSTSLSDDASVSSSASASRPSSARALRVTVSEEGSVERLCGGTLTVDKAFKAKLSMSRFDYKLELVIKDKTVTKFDVSLTPKTSLTISAEEAGEFRAAKGQFFSCTPITISETIAGVVSVVVRPVVTGMLLGTTEVDGVSMVNIINADSMFLAELIETSSLIEDGSPTLGASYVSGENEGWNSSLSDYKPKLQSFFGASVTGNVSSKVETVWKFYEDEGGPKLGIQHDLKFENPGEGKEDVTIYSGMKADIAIDTESTTVGLTEYDPDPISLVKKELLSYSPSDFEGGTEAHPYQVGSLAELQSIATGFRNGYVVTNCILIDIVRKGRCVPSAVALSLEASLAAHYVLTADIDATPTASGTWQMSVDDGGTPDDPDDVAQHGFLPIGNPDDEPFTGSFDGAGYTIIGLHIARRSTNSVGLFGRVEKDVGLSGESSGLIQNVALAGGAVSGSGWVGGLVGYNYGGTVQTSFATGNVNGTGNSVGGLVGRNAGSSTIQDSFATGSISSTGEVVGGLVGYNYGGTVQTSFASGNVNGAQLVGGLVGHNTRLGGTAGIAQDVYALGRASCSDTGCTVGGLIGQNYTKVTVSYQGTLRRAYYNSDAYATDPGAVGDNTDDEGSAIGTIMDASAATEAQLKALTCSGATASVFRWDHDEDGTANQACSSSNETNFPWDFGSDSELPVLNGTIGGVLDAAGQRALLNFDASSLAQSAFPGDEVTLDASGLVSASAGNTFTYHWSIPSGIDEVVFASDGSSVTFDVPEAALEVGLTIIERDADGNIVRVYSDAIAVVPQDGSADHPYQIDTLAELQSIATGFKNEVLDAPLSEADSLAAHYVQTGNIDATPTTSWNDAGTDTSVYEGFRPIGNCGANNVCGNSDDARFSGGFDGAGYTISGLHIDRASTDGVGLFGLTSSTVLRDVALEGGSVSGFSNVGGLVGSNSGTVQTSFASGDVSGTTRVGGLVGENIDSGKIEDSFARGDASGTTRVGGLVGSNSGTVQTSFASGDVSGSQYVGGLVGSNSGTVQTSFASGDVTGEGSSDDQPSNYVGGLVGENIDSGKIEDSFATGNVSGATRVGGLVGSNSGKIEDSFARGDASGTQYVGGLVGFNEINGTVQRGYCVDTDGTNCVGSGASTYVSRVTPDALAGLTCAASTVFRWDDDGDDPDGDGLLDDPNTDGDDDPLTDPPASATVSQDCASATSANFPWDFGSTSELPVLNGTIGGLDADGQRTLAFGEVRITFAEQELSIAEDAAFGTSVGSLAANVYPIGSVTFEATHSVFDVSNTGVITLKTGQSLDHETTASYEIEVTVSAPDADPVTRSITISVVNIDQEGTAAEPYLVDTLAELQSIATGFQNEALTAPLELEASFAVHYVLTANIDASPTAAADYNSDVDTGYGFLPIGNCGADGICFSDGDDSDATGDESADDKPFTGSFDGAGYTISGLHIDRGGTRGVGLFGFIGSDAVLHNIALVGGTVSGGDYVGGVVGINNGGTIQFGYATGTVTGNWRVGGLAGRNYQGTIRGSFASGDVSGSSWVGGLVGENYQGTIRDSFFQSSILDSFFALGSVTGGGWVGGLAGRNYQGTIRGSFASGDVSGDSLYVGGLVGRNHEGTIQHSYALGDVSSDSLSLYVGGLVGWNGSGTIENSYASGSVSGSNNNVGGLVGANYGTVRLGYCVDGAIADDDGNDDGVNDCVGDGNAVGAVYEVTLVDLKALTCAVSTVFLWDDDGDDPDGDGLLDDPNTDGDDDISTNPPGSATFPIDCATAGAANFPWDFGDTDELPTLNGAVYFYASDFSDLNQSPGYNAETTINASGQVTAAEGNTLEYLWSIPPDITNPVFSPDGSYVIFTAPGESQEVGLTIIERGADGSIVGINSGQIAIYVPRITFAAQTFSIAEDAAGTSPEALFAISSDGSGVAFAATHGVFNVSNTGGITLKSGQSLDYETTTSYAITVTASAPDAKPVTQTVTVNVTNVLENTIAFAAQELSIAEDSTAGAVDTLMASISPAGSITFSDPDDPRFAVNSTTGDVTLKAGQSLDYEALPNSYDFTVTASAPDAESVTQIVTISVTDVQDGTAAEPYKIDTLAELQSIATGFKNDALTAPLELEASLAAHYVLTGNIVASPTADDTYDSATGEIGGTASSTADVGNGFLPIGSNGETFTGSFDGAGYTISGLHIDRASTDGVGLFGLTSSTTVLRDVALEGGSVSGNNGVGGLVGLNYQGTIQDSYATGSVSGDNNVGGLVGSDHGTIQDSFASGNVSGSRSVGGLVGGSHNSSTIRDSFATGSVSGNNEVGGLVGYNGFYTIEDSFASGSVSGNNEVGGLVGLNYQGTIRDSFAAGSVSGNNGVGGLVGHNDDSVGELVGYSGGTVQDSYASGLVSGNTSVGGLIGYSGGTVQDSYASGLVSGNTSVGGLIGYSGGTAQRAHCIDVILSDINGNDLGFDDCIGEGSGTNTSRVTPTYLRAVDCHATTVFRWDDPDDDPDGGDLDCAMAGAANFPWDFGISGELPVLNGGVLDAAGQRALINFDFDASSLAQSAPTGEDVTLDASGLVSASAGNTLTYHWSIPPDITDADFTDDGSSVTFTVPEEAQEVGLTIIERDADGNIVRVYSDAIAVVPQDGSADHPYQVDSLEELQSIAIGFQNEGLATSLSVADSLAAHYIQTGNIDASPTTSWNDAGTDTSVYEGFRPIGNCGANNVCGNSDDARFSGGFDGAGYTISGLHIDRASTDGVGLFGLTSSTVLRDVALEGGSVSGDDYVGGAGRIQLPGQYPKQLRQRRRQRPHSRRAGWIQLPGQYPKQLRHRRRQRRLVCRRAGRIQQRRDRRQLRQRRRQRRSVCRWAGRIQQRRDRRQLRQRRRRRLRQFCRRAGRRQQRHDQRQLRQRRRQRP